MKTALVTGAGGGIGAAIAHALADAGYHVVVLDRSSTSASAVVEEITGTGGRAEPVTADIADATALAALCERIEAEHGRLDLLVNCAALSGTEVLEDLFDVTPESWRRVVEVNLSGTFFASQAAARVMVRHGGGCIVNISSVSGIGAEERATSYCAAKAGVIGLTRSLALDLAPLGVRVCAIAPGDIDTAKSRAVAATGRTPRLPKGTPLGAGRPEDIAAAVVFVAGDGARFITGTTLVVDGGLMAY